MTMTGFAPLRERLHADADLGREHLPADVAVALAGHFDRLLDRLAVAHPRLVDADVQLEVAQQPVLDHFQVQLAHAADERLAGLLVFAGAEGRVLPLHHLQHVGQLLALGRGLRLDGHRDDGFGEGDRFQQDRLLRVAERVAGDRVAQADDADDVAGRDRLDLLAAVGLDPPQLRHVFLLVLAGVVDAAVGLQRAGIDADVVQIAVPVGLNLEHQAAERLVGVGLADELARPASSGRRLRPAARRPGWADRAATASSTGCTPIPSRAEPHSTGTPGCGSSPRGATVIWFWKIP